MRGTIIKSTGSWYQVLNSDGELWQARVRGKLRLDDRDTSNPIAVGDEVELTEDPNYPDTASISQIYPRRNYIVRRSNKLSSKRQVIAANLDAAVMVASVVAPRTSMGFIDRFLVCCEAFHIPAIVFFNKTDLLGEDGLDFLKDISAIYTQAGYEVYNGSALHAESLKPFNDRIAGKATLFTGHSGVGKSSLLNTMFPASKAKVGIISAAHDKGKHTTTFAEMHIQPNGTRIVDTPGIRDFGVVDVPEKEIGQYFPEFRKYAGNCKFNDCQHTNEPECAIKAAVGQENISEARYYSYLSILRGEDVFD
ncbi:MAG: ribosome small subunit-dependent GTPase A [Bacteroidia bacterium]|nr:ribosome small subunit-dependent GTPase A [Bacteroidia bacterium]